MRSLGGFIIRAAETVLNFRSKLARMSQREKFLKHATNLREFLGNLRRQKQAAAILRQNRRSNFRVELLLYTGSTVSYIHLLRRYRTLG